VELEEQNPTEEPLHQQAQVSTTDPDATCATKGGTPARLGYYDNYLVDNRSRVIVGVQATAARMSQETVARTRYDCSLRPMARTGAPVRGRRCHLRQWRVSAGGSSCPRIIAFLSTLRFNRQSIGMEPCELRRQNHFPSDSLPPSQCQVMAGKCEKGQ